MRTSYCLSLFQVSGQSELRGQRPTKLLGSWRGHQSFTVLTLRGRQTFTLAVNFEPPATCMCLDCKSTPEHRREPHARMRRTCKLHTERRELDSGFKPTIAMLLYIHYQSSLEKPPYLMVFLCSLLSILQIQTEDVKYMKQDVKLFNKDKIDM